MRQPTSDDVLYAHWRHVLVHGGRSLPVVEDEPQCGYWLTRFVKNGPWIPVEIRCEREIEPETGDLAGPEEIVAIVGVERRDAARVWRSCARHPVSRDAYDALLGMHATDPRMAATHAPLDITAAPPRP